MVARTLHNIGGADMLADVEILNDLPASHCREVGRIVVKFSRLEHKLSGAIYTVLQVHTVEGRLAVREPRAPEKLDLIHDLLTLRGVKVATDFKELRKILEDANSRRDQLAHGIWVRAPNGDICLRVTKGNWPQDEQVDGRKKRAVLPQASPITIGMLRNVTGIIENAIRCVDGLGAEIDHARATSPGKFRPLFESTNPLLGNMPIKSPAPRPPSRG
jgi:hypothetical protein